MNRAIYYRGLAFEYKVLSHVSQLALTCDGQPLDAQPDETESVELERYHENDEPYREIIKRVIDKEGNGELKGAIENRERIKNKHEKKLRQGVPTWNSWRRDHPKIRPLLYETDFSGEKLQNVNFSNANLIEAILKGEETILVGANFHEANLGGAILSGADLTGANFCRTDLYKTNLSDAILNNANLQGTQMAMTKFQGATLEKCTIFGIAAWDLEFDAKTTQRDLIITTKDGTKLTVDNLEVAQFIYLLLNNEKIRDVIDTITSKVVLILGRFTTERKAVLYAIKEELRQNYLPVLFDFDKPASKDVTGTVETLARMARFIIADLTDPSSIPHELATVVPFLRTTPVQPLRLAGTSGYSMFDDFKKSYPWVLETFQYDTSDHLISSLREKVIDPAEAKVRELTKS